MRYSTVVTLAITNRRRVAASWALGSEWVLTAFQLGAIDTRRLKLSSFKLQVLSAHMDSNDTRLFLLG